MWMDDYGGGDGIKIRNTMNDFLEKYKEQYDLMCKLRADGLITKEIAKIIGVSNDIIKKWIHKPW